MALKDVSKVFEDEFSRVLEQIDSENYSSCKKISSNFIRWSAMMNYDDGVFIGEVLEAIFHEASSLFVTHDIADEDRESIKKTSVDTISTILSGIKDLKVDEIYSSLKELRVVITKSQFKYWDTTEAKSRSGVFGLEA